MRNRLQHIVNGLRERIARERGAFERSRAGFTLTETLAAVAIMLLASTIVAAGVPAATQAYVAAVDNSNAQVLLSTTTTRLRDELSVADPKASTLVQANAVDESTGEMLYVTFDSAETGYVTSIKYSDDLGLFLEQTDAAGRVVQTPLVPASAGAGANASLRAKADSIEWNEDAGVFTVRGLKVVRGDDVLEHADIDEFDVRVLAFAS